MKKMSKAEFKKEVRNQAEQLLKKNPEATIDDLIQLCVKAGLIVANSIDGSEDLVFEAISGTKYSTLYDACGGN